MLQDRVLLLLYPHCDHVYSVFIVHARDTTSRPTCTCRLYVIKLIGLAGVYGVTHDDLLVLELYEDHRWRSPVHADVP